MIECSPMLKNITSHFWHEWAIYDYNQSYFGQDILWDITQASNFSNKWEWHFLHLNV